VRKQLEVKKISFKGQDAFKGQPRRFSFGAQVDLYKILFYFEAFVHESIILLLPPSTCIVHTVAILLQYYCAIFEPPSTSLWYVIHHTILCIAISCKG